MEELLERNLPKEVKDGVSGVSGVFCNLLRCTCSSSSRYRIDSVWLVVMEAFLHRFNGMEMIEFFLLPVVIFSTDAYYQ